MSGYGCDVCCKNASCVSDETQSVVHKVSLSCPLLLLLVSEML